MNKKGAVVDKPLISFITIILLILLMSFFIIVSVSLKGVKNPKIPVHCDIKGGAGINTINVFVDGRSYSIFEGLIRAGDRKERVLREGEV